MKVLVIVNINGETKQLDFITHYFPDIEDGFWHMMLKTGERVVLNAGNVVQITGVKSNE